MAAGWKKEYNEKLTTAREAVNCVKSGDTVYVGTCTSVPYALCNALGNRAGEIFDVTLTGSQHLYPEKIFTEEAAQSYSFCTYFMGAQERAFRSVGGKVDYTSIHLSQIEAFCKKVRPARVAFFEVSLPDENGFMNYGATGVGMNKFVKEAADIIIAEVNPHVPYVYGEDNLIHVSEADMIVEGNQPLFAYPKSEISDDVKKISAFLLDEIPDGACIQLGIGEVANAVGLGLIEKNDLGCHTELINDSVMELMKAGVITNKYKQFIPGKTTTSFSFGSEELYEFLDRNEEVYFLPFSVENDPVNISKNDNMISINTALYVDVFGQVCADNLQGCQYSGTGGQLDFVKGAQMSKGGKSFIAIPSTGVNKKGERYSKINGTLPLGSVVTTPRSEVQYIVTEYGCADLKNLSMKDRVKAMISLAHPDFREQLREEAGGLF